MSLRDDNIPLADDDPQGNLNIDFIKFIRIFIYWNIEICCFFMVLAIIDESTEDLNRDRSTDSLPSIYNDGSSSGTHSLEPDINPDEQEEKARLISQVLELQNTLDGGHTEWPQQCFFFHLQFLTYNYFIH